MKPKGDRVVQSITDIEKLRIKVKMVRISNTILRTTIEGLRIKVKILRVENDNLKGKIYYMQRPK